MARQAWNTCCTQLVRGKAADVWSGGWRAGTTLVARGEFSMVIAGLGVGLQPSLGPLSAYVLFLAILGTVLARLAA